MGGALGFGDYLDAGLPVAKSAPNPYTTSCVRFELAPWWRCSCFSPWVQLRHQDRIYQRLQGQEVQPGMQHAAAGVRSGLAARRHHALLPTG
jgi:hypothetical protein